MVKFGSWGVPKNKVLLNDVSNNFLEEGAIISDRNTNTVFMGNGIGRTPCWFWTMPSTCKSVLNSVHIHEMMHSLFKLCDDFVYINLYAKDSFVYLNKKHGRNLHLLIFSFR